MVCQTLTAHDLRIWDLLNHIHNKHVTVGITSSKFSKWSLKVISEPNIHIIITQTLPFCVCAWYLCFDHSCLDPTLVCYSGLQNFKNFTIFPKCIQNLAKYRNKLPPSSHSYWFYLSITIDKSSFLTLVIGQMVNV